MIQRREREDDRENMRTTEREANLRLSEKKKARVGFNKLSLFLL